MTTTLPTFAGLRWNLFDPHVLLTALRGRAATTVTTRDIALPTGQLQSFVHVRGSCVECLEGSVWLTHSGDCRDVILQAGQRHSVDRNTKFFVSAAGAADLFQWR